MSIRLAEDPYFSSSAKAKNARAMSDEEIVARAKSAAAKMQFLSFESDKNDRDRLKRYYSQVFAVNKQSHPIIAKRLRYKAIDKLARRVLERTGTNTWKVKSTPTLNRFVLDELWDIRGFPTALRNYQDEYNAKIAKPTSRSRMSENYLYNYYSQRKN